MNNIIKFDNSINETSESIKLIFNKELKNIKNLRKKFDENNGDIINDLDYLEGYISNLIVKHRDKNWKPKNTEKKFVDLYNSFNERLKDDDEVWKVFFLSEFIYFSDVNSSLLNEDEDYINLIVTAIDTNLENFNISDTNTIKRIINDVRKNVIKNLFKNIDSEDVEKMVDIVEGIASGINLLTINGWYKDDNIDYEDENDNLQTGILTLDRVYNYYKKQEDMEDLIKYTSFYRNHDIDEEYDDSEEKRRMGIINSILLLKKYPEEYKLYYLDLARNINAKRLIDEELHEIIGLTSLYLKMGEQITEYDYEDLKHYVDLLERSYNNKNISHEKAKVLKDEDR